MNEKLAKYKAMFGMRCPRCRNGRLFQKPGLFVINGVLKMHENCPHCGQKYEIEPGFYYGALWTSYPLVVILELPFLLLALLSDKLPYMFWYSVMILIFAVGFSAILRYGRTFWIYIWVKYDPDWK